MSTSDKFKQINQVATYYDSISEEYNFETFELDLSDIANEFLKYLPERATVLDAGCGTGRDILFFKKRGIATIGIDVSKKMCEMARANTSSSDLEIINLSFEKIEWLNRFDGVWANASLVHLDDLDLVEVLTKLIASLKNGGFLYFSLKEKGSKIFDNTRVFCLRNEVEIKNILSVFSEIVLIKLWISADLRVNHKGNRWNNVILQKRERHEK